MDFSTLNNIPLLLAAESDWALLFLRLALAGILIVHGFPKIRDLKANAAGFGSMGFKPGWLWGTIAAVTEFFGGIALVLGVFSRCTAFIVAGEFVVIVIWRMVKRARFVGVLELDLLILASALALLAIGPGAFTLSWFLRQLW